jgi:hypothetical protein
MADRRYIITNADGQPINAAAEHPLRLTAEQLPFTANSDDALTLLTAATDEPTFAWAPGRRLFTALREKGVVTVQNETPWDQVNVFTEGAHAISTGTALVAGRAHLWASGDARVAAVENASVEASEDVRVEASGRARVSLRERAQVVASQRASVTAEGESTVHGRDDVSITMSEHAWGTIEGRGTAMMRGGASVVASGRAVVHADGRALVTASEDVRVIGHGHVQVIASGRAEVTLYDRAAVAASDRVQVIARDLSQVSASGAAEQGPNVASLVVHAFHQARVKGSGFGVAVMLHDRAHGAVADYAHVVGHDHSSIEVYAEGMGEAMHHTHATVRTGGSVLAADSSRVDSTEGGEVTARNQAEVTATDSRVFAHDDVMVFQHGRTETTASGRVTVQGDGNGSVRLTEHATAKDCALSIAVRHGPEVADSRVRGLPPGGHASREERVAALHPPIIPPPRSATVVS